MVTSSRLRQFHQSEVATRKVHMVLNLRPSTNQMSVTGQKTGFFLTGNDSEALWEIELLRKQAGCLCCESNGKSLTLCYYRSVCFCGWFGKYSLERDETCSLGICEISAFRKCTVRSVSSCYRGSVLLVYGHFMK